MSRLRRIRPTQLLMGALVLIGVGTLTFILRDAVRETVVIPLAYAAWLTDLLLRSLPQGLFLALLLVISAVIVLRGILHSGRHGDELPFQPAPTRSRSRLGVLVRQLRNLDRSQFARERTAQEMRNLVLRVLAQTYHLDPNEVTARVRSGAINVPPEIAALLRNWQGWMDIERRDGRSPLVRLWQWLRSVLSPARRSANEPVAALDDKLKAAIDYVEAHIGNST